jgi:hypothetical protein
MTLAKPLFLAVLLGGIASSVLAADSTQSQTLSNSPQDATSAEIAQAVADPSGLIFSVAELPTLNHPPIARPPLAKLDDSVCLTLRIYKVKRTEHLSDEDTGERGYTTCELGTNYQLRSAIAHAHAAEESSNTMLKK